jgi:hypothetical protein
MVKEGGGQRGKKALLIKIMKAWSVIAFYRTEQEGEGRRTRRSKSWWGGEEEGGGELKKDQKKNVKPTPQPTHGPHPTAGFFVLRFFVHLESNLD